MNLSIKQRLKKVVAILVAAVVFLTVSPSFVSAAGLSDSERLVASNAYNAQPDNEEQQAQTALSSVLAYMQNNVTAPIVGSVGGEWAVLSIARGNAIVPAGYYSDYLNRVIETIKSNGGTLPDSKNKKTEYSRVVIALTSIGADVTNVGGYNLLTPLANFDDVIKQGINGPVFALIAFDTNNWGIPNISDPDKQATRDGFVDAILGREKVGGGWAFSGNNADTDMTGMALQALAPYYNKRSDVKAAVDRAVIKLSAMQSADGGFASGASFGGADAANSESVSQVIVGLTALGINPQSDPRFVKNNRNPITALLSYQKSDGNFTHTKTGEGVNQMSTEQAAYALVAYCRFLDGKTRLYDMTDVAPPKSYTITFNAANGTKASVVSALAGSKLQNPANPKRAKYIFAGWYAGTQKVDFATYRVTGNVTLTAKWTKVNVAKVKTVKTSKVKKDAVTLSWKKISGAKGYAIQYSTNKKKLAKSKIKYVSAKTLKTVVKKLKKSKKYYFRVAAYKNDSTGQKVCGAYSKIAVAKTKKK
jgi:uncharacterized repeat protein (TIGR02543 family)